MVFLKDISNKLKGYLFQVSAAGDVCGGREREDYSWYEEYN